MNSFISDKERKDSKTYLKLSVMFLLLGLLMFCGFLLIPTADDDPQAKTFDVFETQNHEKTNNFNANLKLVFLFCGLICSLFAFVCHNRVDMEAFRK